MSQHITLTPEEAALRLIRRQRMRESLIGFAQNIDIPGAPAKDDQSLEEFDALMAQGGSIETGLSSHHVLLMQKLQKTMETPYGRLMVFMPPGGAKALALDTLIPTPNGWTLIHQLRVGDEVFDENGDICRVVRVSEVFKDRPVYAVRTDCGDEIVADEDHLWRVNLCRKPRRELKGNGKGRPALENRDDSASRFKVIETKELAKSRTKRPMIERAGALQLPPADLPIDPYLLGIWLGDGHSEGPRITMSEDDQGFVIDELRWRGYRVTRHKEPKNFGVLGVRAEFVKLDLLGNKHIPRIYLRGSYEQRLDLLQGLIDTDGTVDAKKGSATFCNTNRQLALGVRELVRSLGVKAGWSESRAVVNGKDCGPCYRVSFYHDLAAKLPRKQKLCRLQQRTPNTYVEAELLPERRDTICIEVDSPSHLFLAGLSMTPTHNSTYCSVVAPCWYMGKYPRSQIILASYGTDLAKKHGAKGRMIVTQPNYMDAFDTTIAKGSSAKEMWSLDNGSEYMSGGLLSGITGNRAIGVILDDPIKGRQDAESKTIREATMAALEDDLQTRYIPGAWMILVQCLTAETPVRMADGSERPLVDIEPYDRVASYDEGRLVAARVAKKRLSGHDSVYKITTTSGRIVRGNERHPFLVETPEGVRWVRIKNLKAGDSLVSLKDVTGQQGRKLDLEFDTSSFTTDTILTIEPDGVEDVYDLEIEGTHNFIASGLVTHNTRWHDEDVAGSLLPEDYSGESGPIECRDGLTWEVINLKAKIETEDDSKKDPLGRCVGEYLWPEWFDANHWKIYEPRPGDPNSPSERRWQALFQQNPRPDSSNQWERDWVNWYELGKHPKHLNFYTSSDYSVSDGEGDYTEHGVAGLDQHGDLWLVDWWYGQTPPDISIDALLRLAKRWGATHGFDERGLIEKAIKPAFMMRQRQMNIFMHIEYLPTVGNKIARFQSFRHMGSSGKVWIPRCPWGERLVDQLCSFRAGSTRDDAVDVCSGFGRGLNDMVWSREKVPEEKKKGLVFGSWEWLTYGTEQDDDRGPRVF